MPATKLDLTINRPVTLRLKYADVYPGKLWADPKDGGKEKQLPPSLKLTGSADGIGDVIVYIPADFSSFLTNAGASSEQKQTKNGTPVTSYTLPANRRTWVVEKVQDAGDRHARVEFYEPNANPLEEAPKALRSVPDPMPWDGKPAVHQELSGEPASLRLYRETFEWVLALVRPYAQAADPEVVFTGQDIAAITATCYIQRNNLGESPVAAPEAPNA